MKFGVLFMPADPPAGINMQRRWQEVIEAAVLAEQCGFDGVFLPEHHFMPSGFCSSPLVALASIAARTQKLHLGTSVVVLPCYHPLKLAEDAAHVDLLSGGRLILGVGMGSIEQELRTFRISREEQVSRYEEAAEVLRRAWSEEEFSFSGQHFQFERVRVTPSPVQKPGPPIWMAGMTEAGIRRAGRMGFPWIAGLLHNRNVLSHWYDLYRNTCTAHGHTPTLAVIRDGWVAEDRAALESEWWSLVQKEHWRFRGGLPSWIGQLDPWLSSLSTIEEFTLEGHRCDRLMAGTPDEVIEMIQSFAQALPIEYLIVRLRLINGPSHDGILRCVQLFGEKVLPAVRAC
jgi:probable F420-dependent oxidoreductase